MGRFIDIEYDGIDEIEKWTREWPEHFDISEWDEQVAERQSLLIEQYGFELDKYDNLVWAGDYRTPHYPYLVALIESGLIPGLEDVVKINIREFPPPQPGQMYYTANGMKPFSEAALSDRIAELGCEHCRSDGFMGGYYYECEDDDGTVSKCRGCWYGFFGNPDEGTPPPVDDDFGLITKWNEQGKPCAWCGCSNFDWD